MKSSFSSAVSSVLTASVIFSAALSAGCAGMWNADHTPPGKLPLPSAERTEPVHSMKELRTIVEQLNPVIGVYPPTFTSPEEKEQVYEKWKDAFLDLQVYLNEQGDTESTLWTAAELARQGHNMDIDKAGLMAGDTIERCLEKFPKSVICHFSAIDYYASIRVTSDSISRMRRSLEFLRKKFAPKINQNVEEKFVQLYLYEGEKEAARAQVAKCLKYFPKSKNRSKLVQLQQELSGKSDGAA